MEKITKPRGTRDVLPEMSSYYQQLEEKSRLIFRNYGYEEIIIPTFENSDLFLRSIGEVTDIVEKEMYVFTDKKGRKLALRPEGTAGVVRAYIENGLNRTGSITKLFYMGPMFRYERPQAGRYREFFQIGAECFGDASPAADAEVISVIMEILAKAAPGKYKLHINSLGCNECRPLYRQSLLEAVRPGINDFCEDCRLRFTKNPLRILDCKIDRIKLEGVPGINKCLCGSCSAHYRELQDILSGLEYDFIQDDRLVRGLDYYTKTIFEIKSDVLEEMENTVAAGGRYDNLVEQLGSASTPACGFALGMERVVALMMRGAGGADKNRDRIFLALADKSALVYLLKLRKRLVEYGIPAAGPYSEKSLKAQLRMADSEKSKYVIVAGEEELRRKIIILKDMAGKTQKEIREEDIEKELPGLKETR